MQCPRCSGKGTLFDLDRRYPPCSLCNGQGTVTEERAVAWRLELIPGISYAFYLANIKEQP